MCLDDEDDDDDDDGGLGGTCEASYTHICTLPPEVSSAETRCISPEDV